MANVTAADAIPRAWVRQATGDPYRFFAYVVEGEKVVESCPHNHRRRNGISGRVFAMRCAERMARKRAMEKA